MFNFYNIQNQWTKLSLLDCFEDWIIDGAVGSVKALPCYVIWGIWLTRNRTTFEDKEPDVERLGHWLRLSFGERRKPIKQACPRYLQAPYIDQTLPRGYFDGPCQGVPGECDLGALLYLNVHMHFL